MLSRPTLRLQKSENFVPKSASEASGRLSMGSKAAVELPADAKDEGKDGRAHMAHLKHIALMLGQKPVHV